MRFESSILEFRLSMPPPSPDHAVFFTILMSRVPSNREEVWRNHSTLKNAGLKSRASTAFR